MKSVKFSTLSYTKLILHAAKYPGQHIGGYLIGTSSGDGVNVDDILPLCHGNPVGPLFELAGTISDFLFPAPQKVLGYYYANERVGSREVAPYIPKVLATIQQNSGGLNLLAEIRSDLLDQQDNLCVEVTSNGNIIKSSSADSLEIVNTSLDGILNSKNIALFGDFENQMDSGAQKYDCSNIFVLEALARS